MLAAEKCGVERMPLLKRAKVFAGISVDSIGLRYVEISGTSGSLSCRCVLIPVSPPPVCRDLLVDETGLLPAFAALKKKVGGFSASVSLGLPSRDCFMRAIELPPMELEEARSVIGFEFEKHFPFPASEATYDLTPIELPGSEGRFVFLVAASRRKSIETLIDVASKVGLDPSVLEPANLAAFRAVCGPRGGKGRFMALILGEEASQLVIAYKNNGIFFRTLLLGLRSLSPGALVLALTEEIMSVMDYARSIFRGLGVEVLTVSGGGIGMAAALEEEVALPVVSIDVWESWKLKAPEGSDRDGWEAAIGLAVRDLL